MSRMKLGCIACMMINRRWNDMFRMEDETKRMWELHTLIRTLSHISHACLHNSHPCSNIFRVHANIFRIHAIIPRIHDSSYRTSHSR